MRINQFVAGAGGLSRRNADAAISAGRVTVAGRTATLGETVAADAGDISLDGRLLKAPATSICIMLNKPAGYISSRTRQGKTPTVYELLPTGLQNLRLAGRLDRDSSGLLLLADDGDFLYRYSHPSAGKRKVYEITLSRPFAPAGRDHLARGVELSDGPSHVTLEHADGRHLTVSLATGRNRQLRRTFGALGYTIERLHRTAIGPYQLGALPEGVWREIASQ